MSFLTAIKVVVAAGLTGVLANHSIGFTERRFGTMWALILCAAIFTAAVTILMMVGQPQ